MNPRQFIDFFSLLALLPIKRLSVAALGTIMVSSMTSIAPDPAFSLDTELTQGEASVKMHPARDVALNVTDLPAVPVSDPMPISGLGAILIFWTLLQHRKQTKVY
ncbi:MAG: hypothetical protein H0X31_13655 [Nostocaceae cyanobacterium]|nr:hypothetical protein [Nostocaceae cyanobacterium]